MNAPYFPGITTRTEMDIERQMQTVDRWQIVVRHRAKRVLIALDVETFHARVGDLEIYRLALTPLWQAQDRNAAFPDTFPRTISTGLVNKFQVIAHHGQRLVAFGPIGNIVIAPDSIRGCGIGTYAMGRLIRWLKQGPARDYTVQQGTLSSWDVRDPTDRQVRDHFYRGLGFSAGSDADGRGSFRASSVSQLQERLSSTVLEAGSFPLAATMRTVLRHVVRGQTVRRQWAYQGERIEELSARLAEAQRWNARLLLISALLLVLGGALVSVLW